MIKKDSNKETKKQNAFVHLHVHSEYSILDSTTKIRSLLGKVKFFGMSSVAITDSGNMFGVAKFFGEAKKYRIKPIIGCEVSVAPRSRYYKSRFYKGHPIKCHKLILLVQNQEGYRNLIKLVTKSYWEGYYYKPRIDKELLVNHSKGLIVLSGAGKGEITQLLLKEKEQEAKKAALFYKELSGKSNFYIELHDHGIKKQRNINRKLIKLANNLFIPLVATNNCHYLDQEDVRAYEILKCVEKEKKLKDTKRLKIYNKQAYLKSQSEMKNLFKDVPDAIKNTVKIADRCNFNMRFAPPKSCMTKTQLRLFNKYNADKKIDFVQKKMAAYCKQGDPKHVCDIVKFKYINTLEAIKIVNQALFIGKSKLRNTLNLLSNSNHLSIKGAFQLLRLKSLIKQDIEIKKAIGLATKLEGLPQKAEPNDSSIVYSHMTLIEQIPLYKADDDVLTSQFTVEDLKKLRFTVLDI